MRFTEIISYAGYAIETGGVFVVIFGSIYSSTIFLRSYRQLHEGIAYQNLRRRLGRSIILGPEFPLNFPRYAGASILLGLEFLIAGDIIRTVIVDATLENVAVLGIIVLIRTFLSLTLHLEVEGRWPWQTEQQNTE